MMIEDDSMPNLAEIINRRNIPGVLILDEGGNLLFMNDLPKGFPVIQADVEAAPAMLPENISTLCAQVVAAADPFPGIIHSCPSDFFYSTDGIPYSMRAFPLSRVAGEARKHVIILIERVIEQHQVDFFAVQKKYGLSRRELDTLKLVCLGLGNREIAERLFISEHTAKDHVKRILQALGAGSRNEVIAILNR